MENDKDTHKLDVNVRTEYKTITINTPLPNRIVKDGIDSITLVQRSFDTLEPFNLSWDFKGLVWNSKGLCYAMSNILIPNDTSNITELYSLFPEILDYKPENKDLTNFWWKLDDQISRYNVLLDLAHRLDTTLSLNLKFRNIDTILIDIESQEGDEFIFSRYAFLYAVENELSWLHNLILTDNRYNTNKAKLYNIGYRIYRLKARKLKQK